MQPDDKFFDFITNEEGRSNSVYPDSRKLPTIGIGHLLTKSELSSGKIIIKGVPVKYGAGLTDQQVDDLYEQDCVWAIKSINDNVHKPLSQNQFNALLSLVFNIGETAFESSTLLKRINEGRYWDVPAEFIRWRFSAGRPILLERRKRELLLWNS